ncbi:MAG: hypothetical protein L6U16_09100 [Porphyromonadaceae bacterium]|nr:MAG: hypothetical protein L6U16_09100 [Porphyromonadaceae bacterium]
MGKSFRHFMEINLERQPDLRQLFTENIDVKATCDNLSGTLHIPIIPGETLLFIDEIQVCKRGDYGAPLFLKKTILNCM